MANIFDTARSLAVRAPHLVTLLERMQDKDKPVLPSEMLKLAANVGRPGSGDHVEKIIRYGGRIIAGKPVDLLSLDEDQPWSDFSDHLLAMRSGVVVIFGSRGFGKSQLGIRLASNWKEEHNYKVEAINMKWDRQPWIEDINTERLVARIVKVMRWQNQKQKKDENSDGLTDEDFGRLSKKKPAAATPVRYIEDWEINQLKRRVVVIEEAKMVFSAIALVSQQVAREATRNLVNNLRHLDTILICICQKIHEMPDFLQDDAVQFYKYASDEVIKKDYKSGSKRDNRERWIEVLTALHAVQYGSFVEPLPTFYDDRMKEALRNAAMAHTYWKEPVNTVKAWSYVNAPTLGFHGYRGVAPNGLVGESNPDIIDADSWSDLGPAST